jgi:hypothetical protein
MLGPWQPDGTMRDQEKELYGRLERLRNGRELRGGKGKTAATPNAQAGVTLAHP